MPKTPVGVFYQALRRSIQAFDREQIPFTGVIGTQLAFWNLNPIETCAALFRSPSPSVRFEDGVKLLPSLQTQYNTLLGAEEHTREQLADWSKLIHQTNIQGLHNRPFAAALAAERGLELIETHITANDDPVLQFTKAAEGDDVVEGVQSLDELASMVVKASSSAADHHHEQLQHLVDVLYGQYKLKYTPFEWVYDGLAPALLPEVLKRRRGAPSALAVTVASVGRRAGIPLMPFPLSTGGLLDASGSKIEIENLDLPPELAFKLSSRAQASGPETAPWLVELVNPNDSISTKVASDDERLFIDVMQGDILTSTQVADRYPDRVQLNEASDGSGGRVLVTGTGPSWSPLTAWRGLIKTVLQAHQRRGESDLVAHWLYVLLALDTSAAEWESMLQQ